MNVLSVLLLSSYLLSVVLAQLAPCVSDGDCFRPGETCNTVASTTSLTRCVNPFGPLPCFCSPIDPTQLVACRTVADCPGPRQKCGTPTGVNAANICVGCNSIPVKVTASNIGNCSSLASDSPSPGPATKTPTPMPDMTMSPDDGDGDEDTMMEPSTTPTPSGTSTDRGTPGMTDAEETHMDMEPIETMATHDDDGDGDDDEMGGDGSTGGTMPMQSQGDMMMATETPAMMMSPHSGADMTPTAEMSPMSEVSPSPTMDPAMEGGSTEGSTETEGSVEPSPEPICIDVELLKHLPRSNLVFAEDRRASVLCDERGSCATAGHMVHYNGQAMMMRSYCKLHAECSRSVRLVNSVKYRRAVRVVSKTERLEFTSFAARFESGVEEGVLKTLIHMGL